MANYPQVLAQEAECQSHTGHRTGLWFLPARPLRLNTDDDDDHHHLNTLYLRQQGCENPRLFRKGKRDPRKGKFQQHCSSPYYLLDVFLAAPVTIS